MEVLKPKLSIQNICKAFDGKPILKNVTFDLYDGEFLSILGPSGCGKTTLFRIIVGLEHADAGSIMKDGMDISSRSSSDRGMGIVFQNYALFPNMTVLQNVEYALTLRKETRKSARSTAMRILDQIGLGDQLQKRPGQLSGGQQQRVAIARTLATNPDIILLDEPLSALDAANREVMKAELKELQRKFHVTMIFITHDQEEAFSLSDRIMVMNDGKIEQLDTPEEIYRNPASAHVKDSIIEQLDKKCLALMRYTGRAEER